VNPSDARLLYEFDQLRKRTGARPEVRLELLESRRDVVSHRDDLTLELLTLYNQMRRYEDALELLQARRFHPWEGGEGLVSGQYVIAHFMSGVRRLDAGDARGALAHFEAARSYPENLGEGKHLLTDERHIDYYTGESMAALGDAEAARSYWTKAAQGGSSEMFAYYGALALRALGREAEATVILRDLERLANASMTSTVTIDYFATSLPNFLLFEDDLDARNRVEQLYLRALARIGLGAREEAACDLRAVLKLDPNHVWADDQLRRVEAAREFIAQ
jgi:tetratricopeptide (TPR) repeat protein